MRPTALALATLRAAFRRELRRLSARPIEGGPADVCRENALLAFFPPFGATHEITESTLAALAALANGAGPEAVRSVLRADDPLLLSARGRVAASHQAAVAPGEPDGPSAPLFSSTLGQGASGLTGVGAGARVSCGGATSSGSAAHLPLPSNRRTE